MLLPPGLRGAVVGSHTHGGERTLTAALAVCPPQGLQGVYARELPDQRLSGRSCWHRALSVLGLSRRWQGMEVFESLSPSECFSSGTPRGSYLLLSPLCSFFNVLWRRLLGDLPEASCGAGVLCRVRGDKGLAAADPLSPAPLPVPRKDTGLQTADLMGQ